MPPSWVIYVPLKNVTLSRINVDGDDNVGQKSTDDLLSFRLDTSPFPSRCPSPSPNTPVFNIATCLTKTATTRGGGALSNNRLMGSASGWGRMFRDWIDYNGVAFLIGLLERGRIFSGFEGENILAR